MPRPEEGALPEPEPLERDQGAGEPEIGETIQGYELLSLIGRGGAASVYSARRHADGRVVALKVLAASKLIKPRVVQRFRDEARTAGLVQHPSLVELIELVEQDEPRRLAYAMELVEGISLRAKLQQVPVLPLPDAIHIAKQMCLGVEALHQAGVIHRDLKPENVMLVPPERPGEWVRVKILDFGVAKRSGTDVPADAESRGTFVGTPRYMAPEQAAGSEVDARSDLFAVGVMMFEMITGQRPHEGDSLKAVVMAKLKGAPRLTMSPDREILPSELADAVDSCLKLQPNLRPSDARTVIRILDDAQAVLAAVGSIRLDERTGMVRTGAATAAPGTAGTEREAPKAPRQREQLFPPLPRRDRGSDPPPTQPPAPTAVLHSVPPPAEARLLAPPPERGLTRWAVAAALVLAGLIAAGAAYALLAPSEEVFVLPQPEPVAANAEPRPIQLITVPAGAEIRAQGRSLGVAPLQAQIPAGRDGIEIEAQLPGYHKKSVRLERSGPDAVVLTLESLIPSQAAAPAPAPSEVAPPPPPPPKPKPKKAPVEDDEAEVEVVP